MKAWATTTALDLQWPQRLRTRIPQIDRDHRAARRFPGVTPPMRLKARMNAASDS